MSEYLNFDADGYPSFIVPSENGRIEGTPANTTVYLHGFEFKGVDHIFVETGEDEEQVVGAFIWRIVSKNLSEGMFDDLVRELIDNNFDFRTAEEPTEGDLRQFELYIDKIAGKVTNKGIKKWLTEAS